MRVVIIGGGWSGVAAAIQAKKSHRDVMIIERTDMLLGLGNVGGIMRNNGRFTATEEMIALGAGELFNITDSCSRHKNIAFPGHSHASLYDVTIIEPTVRRFLKEKDIEVMFEARVTEVEMENSELKGIYLSDGTLIKGEVFIEATGSTGPMGNCLKYGKGCSMCILRCPSYGPRISISQLAGVEDILGMNGNGSYGAMSGSCKLNKDSLSKEIRDELNSKGIYIAKVPKEDINMEKLNTKVCQQYALKEFAENIILLDTGHAKIMTSYYPLEKLRKVPGFENVRFEDPYAGGKSNSIRYLSMAPRDNSMKVKTLKNLFVGGEKAGLFVGHTEAIVTGTIAGYNASRYLTGYEPIELPDSLAAGDIIKFENKAKETQEGLKERFTFAGAKYFKRMQALDLYTTAIREIENRVKKADLVGLFKTSILK